MTPHPILFVGAGPGDPDLLTLKAAQALDTADVVLCDRLVSAEIKALIPPTAQLVDVGKEGFGASVDQHDINTALVHYGQSGARVVRLKAGDCTVFGRLDEELEAVTSAGLPYRIVPGITSASAAVSALGQSLTKRGRNSAVRLITGHDTRGFADHDWKTLARPGEVAAIYMGKRAARFVQGRLLMFGADPATPVTAVANASRADQQLVSTTLSALPQALSDAALTGPAVILFGLAPRQAQAVLAQPLHTGVL